MFFKFYIINRKKSKISIKSSFVAYFQMFFSSIFFKICTLSKVKNLPKKIGKNEKFFKISDEVST